MSMKRKKTRAIVIIGRRWFDKDNGNTYFSAVTYVNGERVNVIEYEYGYGEMYIQASTMWLINNKHLAGVNTHVSLSRYCKDNNISLIAHVSDVGRKKDL